MAKSVKATSYSGGHLLELARRGQERIAPGQESESRIPIILAAISIEA